MRGIAGLLGHVAHCIATQRRVAGPFRSGYKFCIMTYPLPRVHCMSCRARCRPCRNPHYRIIAHCYVVSQPWLRCIATQRSPLNHDTMFCIATPLGQAMRACALPHAPRAGRLYRRPYHGLIRPCRGLSRLYRGWVLACPCAPLRRLLP